MYIYIYSLYGWFPCGGSIKEILQPLRPATEWLDLQQNLQAANILDGARRAGVPMSNADEEEDSNVELTCAICCGITEAFCDGMNSGFYIETTTKPVRQRHRILIRDGMKPPQLQDTLGSRYFSVINLPLKYIYICMHVYGDYHNPSWESPILTSRIE